ncbi:MAG: hypothetical protein MJA27_21510 [Pseudanabaenales cyanobacterium]|nr:hypothetical protein [Pseudanabaenales cyanobacterium]
MSDTTGFLAGCATTGLAVLLLLVARVGLDESLPMVQSRPDVISGDEAPPIIPVPSPPEPLQEQAVDFDQSFRRDLERQQDLLKHLESQLDDQKVLIRDLEDQLDQQQTETAAIVAQLKESKYSMETLLAQQVRYAESSRLAAGEGQTALLWVGAGVVLILIFGGGLVLVILIIMTAQTRRRTSRAAQITHPINVTPSYRYYQHEFLPPQVDPGRAEQYEPYDYGS